MDWIADDLGPFTCHTIRRHAKVSYFTLLPVEETHLARSAAGLLPHAKRPPEEKFGVGVMFFEAPLLFCGENLGFYGVKTSLNCPQLSTASRKRTLKDGARCRFRTYDPYRVKVMLYH